jgi:phosphatidylserine/phosphatidylglycerophosphate/cardiolipin synthase-like enzyme
MRPLHLLLLALLLAAPVSAFAAAKPSTAPPALELGESRPLETTLGNRALPDARAVWLDMIRGAKGSIDLEEFYFSHHPGQSLQEVVDEIGRAAARGVRVRLLLDAGFLKTYPQPAESLSHLPFVMVRAIDYRRLAGGVQHSKFMVVDGQDAWIGSQNLDWRSLTQIHELGIRVRHEALAGAIESVFASDWAAGDTTKPFVVGQPTGARFPLRVEQAKDRSVDVWLGASPRGTTPAGIAWDRDLIVERLENAKTEVSVQVLQYGARTHGGADSTLHRALLAAVRRGVKVRMVVSDWTLGGSNEPALRDLAAHGVEVKISRVPEWSGGYVPFARVEHCKYMVVDGDWLWIGTSNWEPSYFLDTRNLGLTIHDPVLAKQAGAVFAASWAAPTAAAYGPDTHLPARVHGAKGPAGEKFYGE